jgi:hypothetical protein
MLPTTLRGLALLPALAVLAAAQLGPPQADTSPVPTAPVQFVDVATATGTTNISYGRAVSAADLNGDGWLEILCADAGQASKVFERQPGGTYLDMAQTWGFPVETGEHWSSLAADFDNDGDVDVYNLYGGFLYLGFPNRLFRNDLKTSGTFTEVTATAGAISNSEATFGGSCFDYDRDGFLDVFQSSSGLLTGCTVLRNTGGLNFQDVSVMLGVTVKSDFRHCGTGDFNNDGWPDAGAGSMSGRNVLYKNLGGLVFLDVAPSAGIDDSFDNFGFVFTDFDNDGNLDVFLPKYQRTGSTVTSKVYLNNGDETFRDVSSGSGLGVQEDMGHDVGDLDADGYPDIYIGTGSPARETYDPLHFVVPDGQGGILAPNLARQAGVNALGPTRCHGMSMADFDRDGDIDVYVNNGGPSTLPNPEANFFWSNQGNDNGWVSLELRGVVSNASAVGTRSVAFTTTGREVHRMHSVGRGFANSPSPVQHYGIGTDGGVDRIEITWPSGIRQVLLQPALSTWRRITETGVRVIGTPQLGQPFALETCGPAGQAVELFSAFATTSVPLPQFGGVLELAGPLASWGTQTLATDGTSSLPLVVPNDPLLTGLTVHFQAWVHPPGSTSGGTLTRSVPVTIQ